jgi:hypothetical protein
MHEILGQCVYAPAVFGNNAPDSGHAELLAVGANEEQKRRWMQPVLDGKLRSAFSMTEPGVGADPTLLTTRAERVGDEYVINGRRIMLSFFGTPSSEQRRCGDGTRHARAAPSREAIVVGTPCLVRHLRCRNAGSRHQYRIVP